MDEKKKKKDEQRTNSFVSAVSGDIDCSINVGPFR